MAWFADLGTRSQIAEGPYVRAVGWLDGEHAFPMGEVSPELVERLQAFARAWSASTRMLNWPAAGGAHLCELCGEVRSAGNFGVPAGDLLYVCPEMVAHYVEAHGYWPPDAFLTALAAAPLPWTTASSLAVRRFRWTPGLPRS